MFCIIFILMFEEKMEDMVTFACSANEWILEDLNPWVFYDVRGVQKILISSFKGALTSFPDSLSPKLLTFDFVPKVFASPAEFLRNCNSPGWSLMMVLWIFYNFTENTRFNFLRSESIRFYLLVSIKVLVRKLPCLIF